MENDDFEITLARVRDLMRNPAFQAFADEYMQHRSIHGNTDRICGNHRKIYDELGTALRIVYEKQPETFQKVSKTMQSISISVREKDLAAALLSNTVSIAESIKSIDGSVESMMIPALIVFFAILAEVIRATSIEEHSLDSKH